MVMVSDTSLDQRAKLQQLATLLSGNSAIAALTLLRNIFAARMIGVEQFGIAAALAIVATGIEMATNLGLPQMLVRDARGATPRFQASLHFVQLIRGALAAGMLYLLAPYIAAFFQMEEVAWAFRVLAFMPLANSLLHLDAFRFQRSGRFGPSIVIGLGPALLALMLIWPLFETYGDFRVLLFASFVQCIGTVILSHLIAEQRFKLVVARRHWPDVWTFGGPMALNGLLLLFVFHGEKILVAHLSGPADLAVIAMGFTLTLTPALILGRSLQTYALPKLSQTTDQTAFEIAANRLMKLCLAVAILATSALCAFSPLVTVLLGSDFSALQGLFPLLAILHGLRIARSGPTIAALAKGHSLNAVWGNLPRIAALPLGYLWLSSSGGLTGLIWIALAAEAAGLALSYVRLRQTMRVL